MWLSLPSALLPSAPATEALSSGLMPLSHITDANTVLPLTWSGKPMRLRSLRTAWKRATWLTRLSGLTSAPSTLDAGAERWIASLRASPASRIPSPEAEKALMTRAGFGPTSPGSCVIAVRGSSCWKTSQGSLLPVDSDQSSVTWPKWGSMRNGAAYLRPAWAPATNASAFSSWPTPDCNTATYSNGERGQNIREAVANWPTPAARIAKGGGKAVTRPDGKSRMDMLDWRAEAFSPPAPTIPDGPTSSLDGRTSRPRLNPAFVCWLMGLLPLWTNIAHTNSDSAEMELWSCKLQQQLRRCLGDSDSAGSKAA